MYILRYIRILHRILSPLKARDCIVLVNLEEMAQIVGKLETHFLSFVFSISNKHLNENLMALRNCHKLICRKLKVLMGKLFASMSNL